MLTTARLKLRDWRDEDLPAFAALNADPAVMEFFPNTLTAEDSNALATRIRARIAEHNWGFWAVEVIGGPAFIGCIGLSVPRFDAHFMPCVEVGWRLAKTAWGHGYATEAARAAMDFGFNTLGLAEIVSFTTTHNQRSRHVMEKLGMTTTPADDFEHPLVGGPLRKHVLYRRRAPS
ncbi:MAG: GNAT family N-acetyltransferase [Rhodospirillaceae bacterium]|nr:GNAT family N-acetyltransferase [Rhodospirillaceae bacterium]